MKLSHVQFFFIFLLQPLMLIKISIFKFELNSFGYMHFFFKKISIPEFQLFQRAN
jgi:hypothetical protein